MAQDKQSVNLVRYIRGGRAGLNSLKGTFECRRSKNMKKKINVKKKVHGEIHSLILSSHVFKETDSTNLKWYWLLIHEQCHQIYCCRILFHI